MCQLLEILISFLLIWISCIHICHGYDMTFTWEGGDCIDYTYHYLTQYQTALITWNGAAFTTYRKECRLQFRGKNDENVDTNFHVCFKVLDHLFTHCNIKLNFIEGLWSDYGDEYDCYSTVPEKWCTKSDEYGKITLKAPESSISRLKIEVSVTADVSLTIAAALGIAAAVLIVVGVASTVCIIWCCKKRASNAQPSEGRVIRSPEDLRNTQFEGQTLIGYPTQQTEMVPAGHGRYRPQNVTVQQTMMMPPNVQPQVVYTSQTPVVTPQAPVTAPTPAPTNVSSYQNQPNPTHEVSPSAPPPSYDTVVK